MYVVPFAVVIDNSCLLMHDNTIFHTARLWRNIFEKETMHHTVAGMLSSLKFDLDHVWDTPGRRISAEPVSQLIARDLEITFLEE